jgi:serine/threonine protein kinase
MTLLSKINHPSIITLYDLFEHNNSYFVVMEYCKGGSIVDLMNKFKRKSERIIANIVKQLLSALSYLHSVNIVHRDIKLDNIVFLDKIEEVEEEFIPIKIIDFGTAVETKFKIIQNYPISGTLSYLAP